MITPARTRPTASRMPLTMKGSVPGITRDVKMRRSGARKLRATSRSWRSTVRTPSTVGKMIEKNPPKNTMIVFISKPRPTQRTTRGIRATRGRALKKFSHGSNVRETRRYHPIAMPSGTASSTAASDPIASSDALIFTSSQKRAFWTSSAPAAATSTGELKKNFEIKPASEPTCHAAMKLTIPAALRIARSLPRYQRRSG